MYRTITLLISVVLLFQSYGFSFHNTSQENYLPNISPLENLLVSNNVQMISHHDTPGTASKLFLQENSLYLADTPDWNGTNYVNGSLRIFDVTNADDVIETGFFVTENWGYDVWVDGPIAYLSEGYKTRVLSIETPSNITETTSIPAPSGAAFSIAKKGDYVYVGYGNGFQVIDVSNLSQISQYGIPLYWMVNEITIHGDFAYLAAWDGGVVVMGLSNPWQPVLVGRFQIASAATYDVAIEGDYAYVAGGAAGLYILDISDPGNIQEVGHISIPGRTVGVDVENGIAYIANLDQGLRVINCINPAQPYEAGYYLTTEPMYDVLISNHIVYAANGKSGLSTFLFTADFGPLTLLGSATGYIRQNISFSAYLAPDKVSGQMSYVWTASDQQTITHFSTQADTVSFTWDTSGKKIVTLKVLNSSGEIVESVSKEITILDVKEFTVDRFVDVVDAVVGDGICQIESGGCTLRAAIQEANYLDDLDYIVIPAGTYLLSIHGTEEDGCLSGDLDVKNPLVLIGAGPDTTVIDANGIDRVMDLHQGEFILKDVTLKNGVASGGGGIMLHNSVDIPTALIENVHILNNTATGGYGGGGVAQLAVPLTIKNSLISGNKALGRDGLSGIGGGISSSGEITTIDEPLLVIDQSIIADNTADSYAAGLSSDCNTVLIKNSRFTNNQGAQDTVGGAIGQSCFQGKIRILGSTIDNNRASDGAGIGFSGERLEITNSTIGNNTGGAIVAVNAFLQNVTVAMNGGSLNAALRGNFTLSHTLVAYNGPFNCNEHSQINTQGFNLASDYSCKLYSSTDQQGANPQLNPLGDYGGFTPTYSLKANSPALDAGSNTCVDTDQRGINRPSIGNGDEINACDIGAVEDFNPVTLSVDDIVVPGDSLAEFTISLTPKAPMEINVTYHTVDGSANGGTDYQEVQGDLTFSPGESVKKLLIPVYKNILIENEEVFFIVITSDSWTLSTAPTVQGTATIEKPQKLYLPFCQRKL